MNRKGAVCVLSGGQDSSTCLFWAMKQFKEVHAITFDYGQRHSSEIDAAIKLAKLANVASHEVIEIPVLNNLTVNALTRDIPIDPGKDGELPNTFVDGRNLLFLTFAAIHAKQLNCPNVVIGVCMTDFSGYSDCRNVFVQSANVTLNLAMGYDFVIHTPLMWLNKEETWELADQLDVLDTILNNTVTCYNGIPGKGCGECPACLLRSRGLVSYLQNKK